MFRRPRRPRRYGPYLSARGVFLLTYTLAMAFVVAVVVRCLRS